VDACVRACVCGRQGVMIMIWQQWEGTATTIAGPSASPPLHTAAKCYGLSFTEQKTHVSHKCYEAFFVPNQVPWKRLAVSGTPGRPFPWAHPAHRALRIYGPCLTPTLTGAGCIRTCPPEVVKLPIGPCSGHQEQCRWRSCTAPLPASTPDGDEHLHLVINEEGEVFSR
jgi:hypothetical protein